MSQKMRFLTLACFILSLGSSMEAREPYRGTVIVSTESTTVNDPTILSLINSLKTATLEQLVPIYTPTSAATIAFNLRGLRAIGSFAANSTAFTFVLPNAGISEVFMGATRDDSLKLFHEFISNGANGDGKIFKAYAKYSPIDPIAGNPTSLLAQMAQSDYLLGRLSPLSGCDSCWSAQPVIHQFQTGLGFERAFSEGFDSTVFSLPLRYSYSPNLNWALIIDAPITLLKNGGAYSAFTSLGVGFRFPLTSNWSVTPTLRFGGGGSVDLVTAGTFFLSGINSNYDFHLCNYVLSMTNYAGYYTSTNFYLGSTNCNYHLYNFVFKNGLTLTSCQGFDVCGRPIHFNVTFIDSAFAGHALYIQHYDEVGVSLFTTNLNPCLDYDCLSLGFAYQFGEQNFRGYNLNLTYQF